VIVCVSAQIRQGRLLQLAATGGRAGGPGGGQSAAVRRVLLHGRAGGAAAVGAAAARRGAARAAALPGGRAALLLPAHALPLLRAAPEGGTPPYPIPWAAARPRCRASWWPRRAATACSRITPSSRCTSRRDPTVPCNLGGSAPAAASPGTKRRRCPGPALCTRAVPSA